MVADPLPHVTPRPAATLLMLRDGAEGLEVLMTSRHEEAAFAGGALVFPGGKVDPADHALAGHYAAKKIGRASCRERV